MNTENKTKFKEPDYKKIRELSQRINCTVEEEDFDTSHPNPYRINYIARDINEYRRRCRTPINNVNSERLW